MLFAHLIYMLANYIAVLCPAGRRAPAGYCTCNILFFFFCLQKEINQLSNKAGNNTGILRTSNMLKFYLSFFCPHPPICTYKCKSYHLWIRSKRKLVICKMDNCKMTVYATWVYKKNKKKKQLWMKVASSVKNFQ